MCSPYALSGCVSVSSASYYFCCCLLPIRLNKDEYIKSRKVVQFWTDINSNMKAAKIV